MAHDDPDPQHPAPSNYQRTTGGHLRWQPPTAEELQQLLTGYEVIAMIGTGGMGAVYKGRQQSLDRIVAIKILPPEAAQESNFAGRFRNEARTMAKMNHPAIVNVYDFGETPTGLLYIVMEFIDGTDVAQMIRKKGKLTADYALAITAHVCDALQYAHKNGVIHRDIKPANVLINMEGAVKVADFGLSKITDASGGSLTMTNMALGTPEFLAPEALSPGTVVDGRADLYAVGVMLYNMLCGDVPRGMFRLPSQQSGTDPRFDPIVIKAMEMDREQRYQTALDLRKDLDVILTTPLVQAVEPSKAAPPPQPAPQQYEAGGDEFEEEPYDEDVPVRKKSNFLLITVTAAVLVPAVLVLLLRMLKPHEPKAAAGTDTAVAAAGKSPPAVSAPPALPDIPRNEWVSVLDTAAKNRKNIALKGGWAIINKTTPVFQLVKQRVPGAQQNVSLRATVRPPATKDGSWSWSFRDGKDGGYRLIVSADALELQRTIARGRTPSPSPCRKHPCRRRSSVPGNGSWRPLSLAVVSPLCSTAVNF